jgi:hypothetical protein
MEAYTAVTPSEEYLLLFADIAARCNNIPVCVLHTLSQLNSNFNILVQYRLDRLKKIYTKYGHRLAEGYHRKLIAHPIEYTGTATKCVPIPNMLNSTRGVLFMCADPPMFTQAELSQKYVALVNICILMRHPIEFYFKIGHPAGFMLVGKVSHDNIVELPLRTPAGRKRLLARYENGDIGAEMLVPGRYFVDLQLPLQMNPALFSRTNFSFDHLSFACSNELIWYDCGQELEAVLNPDVEFTYRYLTHMILQFKTAPATTPVDQYGVFFTSDPQHINKFSLVRDVAAMERKMMAQRSEDADSVLTDILPTADDILFDIEEAASSYINFAGVELESGGESTDSVDSAAASSEE